MQLLIFNFFFSELELLEILFFACQCASSRSFFNLGLSLCVAKTFIYRATIAFFLHALRLNF